MGVAVKNSEYNTRFRDIGGTEILAVTDGDTTLATVPNANYTIFIQKLRVNVLTDAAQSASFEDTNGTPRVVGALPASPGVGVQEWDYGPQGMKLTEGKNFRINVSAAGLGLNIQWEGYARLTIASAAAGNRKDGVAV